MFQINTASGVPIYEQLIHNVTRLTDSGVLKPHDRLPSVRSLAVELGINPNTVAKAYRELETRGFTIKYKIIKESISSFIQHLFLTYLFCARHSLALGTQIYNVLKQIGSFL